MPIDIPSKPQFNPHEDILKDNPVPSFEKDLLTNGFKRWINNSSFQVYADSDVLYGGTKDEVLIQGANPYKTSFTKNDIKISMYICSDGALLLDMYRNKKSLNLKEIHVFLEINDKHNIGGSVMLVKASSDVTKDKNTIPFADILRTAEGKKVNLSSGLIKNLINKEVLKQENKGFFLFHLIKAILNAKEVLETIALESVGYVFEDLLPNFIERFKIDESVWNPNHTDYKGHLIQTLGLDKEVPKLPEKEIQRIKSKIFNYFDSIIDDGQKNGDAFIALLEENKIFSKGLYLKIKNSWEKLQNIILSVRKRIAQIIEVYWEVLKMVPQMVVAYLCGLVNAVLDALIGLLELIGMLCYTAAYVKDLDNTKVRYIVEQIENLLEMKSKLDIGAYFDLLIEKGQSFLRSVWGQIKNGDISKIKLNKFIPVAYFCGYFIGWVVSIFLEAFFTGGIAAVENIVANIGSLGSRMLRGVKRVGEMGEEALEKFITFLRTAYRNITKNTKQFFEDFKQWLDELIEAVKKKLGIAKAQLHKGGDFTKSFFENAGIAIKKVKVVGKVYGQTKDYTCVANSLKMALSDRNIIKTEEYLATALKTDKNGARILDIPEALHHSYIDDVVTQVEKGTPLEKLLSKMESGDKAIVSIFTEDMGHHAVLIDDVIEGRVIIRDPLPMSQGSSYSVTVEELEKLFKKNAVIIKK